MRGDNGIPRSAAISSRTWQKHADLIYPVQHLSPAEEFRTVNLFHASLWRCGNRSEDIKLSKKFSLAKEVVAEKVNKALTPTAAIDELKGKK